MINYHLELPDRLIAISHLTKPRQVITSPVFCHINHLYKSDGLALGEGLEDAFGVVDGEVFGEADVDTFEVGDGEVLGDTLGFIEGLGETTGIVDAVGKDVGLGVVVSSKAVSGVHPVKINPPAKAAEATTNFFIINHLLLKQRII